MYLPNKMFGGKKYYYIIDEVDCWLYSWVFSDYIIVITIS